MSSIAASSGEIPDDENDATPRSMLFRAVWRWHFYAGIFTIPVIIMLALTGLVYLFRPQIERVLYGDMTHITAGTTVVSYDEQLAAVEKGYPDEAIIGFSPGASPRRSTEFYLDNGAEGGAGFAPAGRTVYVNPYTGDIEGSRNNAYNPAQIALQMHGTLMTANFLGDAKWGDYFVELIACWVVFLVVSGVYLWWPRGRSGKSLKGTLIPRLNIKSARIPWRDVHAITGVLFSFIFLFFLVTGLMWTEVWGSKYGEVATSLGATYPEAPSESVPIEEGLGEGSASWATSQLPMLPSGERPSGAGLEWDPAEGAPLDAVVARAQAEGFGTGGYIVFFPEDEVGSYMATRYADLDSKINQSAVDGKTAFIDQYTAETVGAYSFSEYGFMAKASDWGISLHEGREWGIWSQIAVTIGTLAILVSAATSVVMWYKRRPQGLGSPRRVYSNSAAGGLAVIALTLGIFFPLLGISLIALLIFDFLILRRVPFLARTFGAV
jgi:uncharacterized iron-regulated membrane protein